MDDQAFLQRLCDLSLEEGRILIQDGSAEISDYASIGMLMADEARRQRDISPSISLKLAELLIFLGEHTAHNLARVLGLKAKGSILNYFEQHRSAMEYLDAAGEEFLGMGDEVNWAYTRVPWIVSCAWTGQIELALETALQARNILLAHNERYWACLIDHNTAVIYSQMGQYSKALELYERLLSVYPSLKDQSAEFIERAVAMVEVNKARNLSWLGDFEQAYQLLAHAKERFISLGQTAFIIWTDTNLADLDYVLGYFGSALRRYYQARDGLVQEKIDNPVMLALITLKMATCLVKLNRNEEAYQFAREAVEACQHLGVSLMIGHALREYAITLVASGRAKNALAVLDEAYDLFAQGRFDHHAATTRLQQAELLLALGAVTEAYEQAHTVKEYFDSQNLISRSVRASLVMASALVVSAQQLEDGKEEKQRALLIQKAASLCHMVTSLARRHKLHEEVYRSQHLAGKLAVMDGKLERASRYYRVAIKRIEHILDGLMYDLGPAFLHTTWNIYEDMIDLCLKQERPDYALSYLERARSMALRQYLSKSKKSMGGSETAKERDASSSQGNNAVFLRIQHQMRFWQEKYHSYSALLAKIDVEVVPGLDRETIQSELKQCETRLSHLFERVQLYELDLQVSSSSSRSRGEERMQRSANSIDVEYLRQHLAADQLLLTYFLYQGKLVIFALTTDRLAVHELPDGMERLETLLPLLHARLLPGGWPDPQQPPIYVVRRLLQKLYSLLVEPMASLLPSPSGHIIIVPFGPLHNLPFHALHNGSHFLIEDFQISYLPAASMLLQMQDDEGKQVQHLTERDAANRHPVIFGYSDNQQLPMALKEARLLADMLQGDCYLEEEATIAHLNEKARESSLIHIATHGKSRLDAPNFSSVLLTDGRLNAIDAFHLDLRGCELVTLSGCETGLALIGGGDEQLGLGRAFLAAGAKSLVMSLWSVEDGATSELMQLFYRHLLSGDSRIQALRAAQCALLQRDSFHASPYFWAAFRLIGDTSPLHATIKPLKK